MIEAKAMTDKNDCVKAKADVSGRADVVAVEAAGNPCKCFGKT